MDRWVDEMWWREVSCLPSEKESWEGRWWWWDGKWIRGIWCFCPALLNSPLRSAVENSKEA